MTEQDALRLDREAFPDDSAETCTLIASGASGRLFFRMGFVGGGRILMSYQPDKEENLFYAPLGKILADEGIPVPRILREDGERHLIWMEDVGKENLLEAVRRDANLRRHSYEQAIRILVRFQGMADDVFAASPAGPLPPFREGIYAFEHNYFLEEFVFRLGGIDRYPESVAAELRFLEAELNHGPQAWVHRDFQSQNLVLSGNDSLRLVDFQGLRRGSAYYDPASLLYDPYVLLSRTEREALAGCYMERSGREAAEVRRLLPLAGVQRLLQAMGAYGKLGLGAEIPFFQAQVQPGFTQLKIACRESGTLPELSHWVEQIVGEFLQYRGFFAK